MIFFILIALPLNSVSAGPYQLNVLRLSDSSAYGDMLAQVQNLRTASETLKILSGNPSLVDTINKKIKSFNLPCITNMEEAMDDLRFSTELMEAIGPEVQAIIDTLIGFKQLRTPSMILRESGAMLRLIKPLLEKTRLIKGTRCPAEGGAFGSLGSLAGLMSEMSKSPELSHYHVGKAYLEQSASMLDQSASVISAVTTFVTELQATSAGVRNFCKGSSQYTQASLEAIAVMMEETVNLLSYLGLKSEDSIRAKEKLTLAVVKLRKIKSSLGTILGGHGTSSDCSSQGDLSDSANTLDDISDLVDEVGFEFLKQQLGGDYMDFDFNIGL